MYPLTLKERKVREMLRYKVSISLYAVGICCTLFTCNTEPLFQVSVKVKCHCFEWKPCQPDQSKGWTTYFTILTTSHAWQQWQIDRTWSYSNKWTFLLQLQLCGQLFRSRKLFLQIVSTVNFDSAAFTVLLSKSLLFFCTLFGL